MKSVCYTPGPAIELHEFIKQHLLSMTDGLIKRCMEQEDAVLIQALSQYLGRPAQEIDVSNCEIKIYYNRQDEYDLFHLNKHIGHVVRG